MLGSITKRFRILSNDADQRMNVNMDKLIDDVLLAKIQESNISPMTMSMAINSVCQLLTLMMTTASFELVHVVKVSALHLSLLILHINRLFCWTLGAVGPTPVCYLFILNERKSHNLNFWPELIDSIGMRWPNEVVRMHHYYRRR